jgi:hypothetical protein
MTEMTKFVIEGDVTLAYFTGHHNPRQVILNAPPSVDGLVEVDDCECSRLESKIAKELGFPNESEFDAMFEKLDQLREQGLRPAKGEPDLLREGTKLRITIEVI